MEHTNDAAKRQVRSFLVARDPSVDRRFRPCPDTQVRLFSDINEEDDSEDTTSSISSAVDDTCNSTADGDGALVYLRLRPVNRASASYKISDCGTVLITGPSAECTSSSNNKNQMEKHYSFSEIFSAEVQQREVYEKCIGKKIEAEENFTVLTYGTSGSGKTFTLLGEDERPGIIPRSLENIFTLYASNIYPQPSLKIVNAKATILDDTSVAKETQLRKQILGACADMNSQHTRTQQQILLEHAFETTHLTDTSVFIWISFVEIYNELVHDLLTPPEPVPAKGGTLRRKTMKIMGNDGKVFIKSLTSVYVKNSLEAQKLLRYGLQKVTYASTFINANSSRSHCVFMVDVLKFSNAGVIQEISYKFCDLAGSERLDKTGNVGSRLKEAQRINTSLLVLGRCLDAANAISRKKNTDVIPFRESKLTMLLQSSLLGKEKLAMIVNVTPTDKYYEENLNVLSFSSIAKNIIFKQPVVKQNKSRYSWLVSQQMAPTNNNADAEYMEQLLEENLSLRNEIESMKKLYEEDQEQREQELRNNLVDIFQKDLKENSAQFEVRLKNELDNQKRLYESQIEVMKRKHAAEIDALRDDSESECEENVTKKRRTLN